MVTATAQNRASDGHIVADALYTLAEIESRLGLGVAAMRQARRKGLVVRRIGKRGFVLGRDLIEYVAKCGAAE